MSTPPRLVLDTNVVLDLLHFSDPTVLTIRQAIESRRAHCFASPSTMSELSRVLSYPEFRLATSAQTALLAQYQSWINHASDLAHACPKLPRCADPDDQMFFELAASIPADFLISKDKTLLALERRVSDFKIFTPAEAANFL